MAGNPNPSHVMISSSKLGGALRKVGLICFSMSSFPTEPTSAAVMANTTYSNGKKKTGNEKMRNKQRLKLSTDPQSVAARERRHRISHRFKILQSLVPGGTKMDIVSMLEEAIHYVKFLKTQISLHQAMMMSTMHEDYNLRPLTPCPYSLPPLPSHQSVSLSAPMLVEPDQIAVTPSLPYYFCQAHENDETMFT